MNRKYYPSGNPSGFQYDKPMTPFKESNNYSDSLKISSEMGDDLIIEDNTVYEIDRECYERLKRQRKKK